MGWFVAKAVEIESFRDALTSTLSKVLDPDFVIGDLVVSEVNTTSGLTVRIWTRPEVKQYTEQALDYSNQAIDALEHILQSRLESKSLGKQSILTGISSFFQTSLLFLASNRATESAPPSLFCRKKTFCTMRTPTISPRRHASPEPFPTELPLNGLEVSRIQKSMEPSGSTLLCRNSWKLMLWRSFWM